MENIKQTQIKLKKATWKKLKRKASFRGQTVAELINSMIQKQVGKKRKKQPDDLDKFSFIGAGKSKGKGAGKISQHHDEELGQVFKD